MTPPALTPEQRARAAERALAARRTRAETRVALKTRRVTLGDVLLQAESDPALARMRVVDVLEALPAIGPTKAKAHMERIGISVSRRLRGLGAHQRAALLELFA